MNREHVMFTEKHLEKTMVTVSFHRDIFHSEENPNFGGDSADGRQDLLTFYYTITREPAFRLYDTQCLWSDQPIVITSQTPDYLFALCIQ